MTNIKDVAQAAGVSVATVSRYINKKGYVSTESKDAIQNAIETLQYKPNLIARSLSTKQSNIIGLLLPDITNPFFPELARAVEDVALSNGYTVVLCNSDQNSHKEKQYIEMLTQKYVAGFILTSNLLKTEYYKSLGVPIVGLDRANSIPFPTVSTDNRKGAKLATEYLIECGATNIVCLRGPKAVGVAEDRLLGYLEGIKNVTVESHIIESPFDFESSMKITHEFLSNNKKIDGIFACSDASAIGAIKAAHSLGIDIPGQLQIIGFDGVLLGEMITPSLTTIAQNIYQMGASAAKLLIQQIEGEQPKEERIQLAPTLVVRETTRKGDDI